MDKTCFKCGRSLPLKLFYSHPQMRDGHLGKCKDCTKHDTRMHRLQHLDAIRAYDRIRARLPHRKENNRRQILMERKLYPARAAIRQQAQRHHRTAPNACQMCGRYVKLSRHHPDYALPLLIVWLCSPCHAIADRQRRINELQQNARR